MELFDTVVRLTDAAIPCIISMQQKDPESKDYNGQIIIGKGFAEPGASAPAAAALISAYFCPESKYFQNEVLLTNAINALSFLLSHCHEDGSLDLMETNFHDCTCNAFAVQILAYTTRLLEREAKTANELKAKALAFDFLQQSANAMINGGFHTPNHRWVVASALSLCSNILKDESCADMAKVYLSEDIDQNEEGDYTERSAGGYDAVCNESLCILAQELNMPGFYDYIERNIEKNLFYLEPDFTILTMASTRQDYGKDVIPVKNLLPSLLLYRQNGSETALTMATELFKMIDALELKTGAPMQKFNTLHHQNLLTHFLLSPSLAAPLPQDNGLPAHYEKVFELAGIVRYRNGSFSMTIIKDNPTFLKVQNGSLKSTIRLAASFFGKGQMKAQTITKITGGYRCFYRVDRGYVRPVENLHEKDWKKIPPDLREKANMQTIVYQIDVMPYKEGVYLHITSEGTPNVPLKLEFIFDEGGMLYTGHTTQPGMPGGYAIIGEGFSYERYGEKLLVEGGFNRHEYAPTMRGSEPIPQNAFCVFFTDFTPVDAEIKLTTPKYTEI